MDRSGTRLTPLTSEEKLVNVAIEKSGTKLVDSLVAKLLAGYPVRSVQTTETPLMNGAVWVKMEIALPVRVTPNEAGWFAASLAQYVKGKGARFRGFDMFELRGTTRMIEIYFETPRA